MIYVLALALLSLFTAVKWSIGPGQIRPFDMLVLLLLLLVLLQQNRQFRLPKRLPTGFLVLIPYLVWHVISAMTVSTENGIREVVQTTILVVFALIMISYSYKLDIPRFGKIMLIGMLLITAYSIYWHIDEGFLVGWKRLNDPKRIFSFLPMIVGCMIIFSNVNDRVKLWLIWGLIGIIIVLSGERKAFFVYLIICGTLLTKGRLLAVVPAIALGLLVLMIVSSTLENDYLSRQFSSIVNPWGSILPEEVIAGGEMPASLSNTQRAFAFQLSSWLFFENPMFGVGTNRYTDIVQTRFAHLPEWVRLSPHGEFLRIAAENGLIGLTLYLFVWISAIVRLRRALRRMVGGGLLRRQQARMLAILILVPSLSYVGLEASGTHSVVVLIFVSLSPSFCRWALRGRSERILQERRAATIYGPGPASGPLSGGYSKS